MGPYQAVIELSVEERDELTGWSKSRTLPAGDLFKARLILAFAGGKTGFFDSLFSNLALIKRSLGRRISTP